MLTDSHCHLDRLDLSPYNDDLGAALNAARERGVERFLCIGIDIKNFPYLIDITKKISDVYLTAGIHPMEFNDGPVEFPEEGLAGWLEQAGQTETVVGIGETGLDYYYSSDAIEAQQQSFVTHLQVAGKLNKPVVVHTRDARDDTIRLIREYGNLDSAGVLHCFTEDWEMAKKGMDLNFYISFSGIITFKNAHTLREVVEKVPLERILVETDSPWLAPVPYRGKSNEPKNVVEVARCIAEIKGVSYEQVCEQTGQNFARLFRLRGLERENRQNV